MALNTNLKAYYKFDGNGDATDSGPNAFHLTNGNSATYGTGKLKTCAVLTEASDQYFRSTNSSLYNTFGVSGQNFSMSIWIKPSAILGTRSPILCTYGPSVGFITSLESGLTLRLARYGGAAGSYDSNTSVTFTADTWAHLVVTYDSAASGGTIKIYKNGSLAQTITSFGSSIGSSTGMVLGNDNNLANGGFYTGSMDELGIWDKVLDSTEVTELYNSGAGLSAPFGTGISISNAKTATAGGGNATVTITGFVVEGDDNCVVASVCNQNNGGSTSGVTCNGVAMTLVDTQAITGSNGVTLWALYGATTGNIVATRTGGTGDRITICAVNHTGVKSTTAIASLPKAKATGSGNIAAALTTTVDNSWVTMGTYVSAGGDVSSAGSNTTKRVVEPEIGDHWDSGSAVTPAGSRTLNVTNTGTPAYSYVMMALEPKTATSTTQIKTWTGVANT